MQIYYQMELESVSRLRTEAKLRFFNRNTLIIGKRECGKTTLIRHIYQTLQDDIDHVYYLSTKLDSQTVFPTIHNSLDTQIVRSVIKSAIKSDGNKMIILDDAKYSKELMNSREFQNLILNNRPNKITFIMVYQYPINANPIIRSNIDNVFIANDDCYSFQQKLYDHYGGQFESLKTFINKIKQLEPYEFLTINKRSREENRIDTLVAPLYLDSDIKVDNCREVEIDLEIIKEDQNREIREEFESILDTLSNLRNRIVDLQNKIIE